MISLKEKKLLVIGGAFQHCKLVEAAKELGVTVYVTDYLPVEEAPAKQIADKYYMYNISEIDAIVDMCKQEHIDGVIATSLDACQLPYQKICEKLGVPCFGVAEQYRILTDKTEFKSYCRKNGVDVIPDYSLEEFENQETCEECVQFPVFVKPCDSRGSRGQSICNTYVDAIKAIEFARQESSNGKVVIEKYMGGYDDFSMTILVVNGKAYPFRTVDRILGRDEDCLDKLAVGAVMPSIFTKLYMDKIHPKVERLIADIGLVNAPIFMQGFVDGDTIRFYDPGLRFPGGEYERMFMNACGKNVFYPLIEFALTGMVSEDACRMQENDVYLNGKIAVQVLPALRAGRIASICGVDEIMGHSNVVSLFTRYKIGDEISENHNVNQRFCEIDIVCNNENEAKDVVDWVYRTLKVEDTLGRNMIISRYDTNQLVEKRKLYCNTY